MIYILFPYHLGSLKYDMISKDWLPSLNAQDRILRISAFHNKSKSLKKRLLHCNKFDICHGR